MLLRHRWDRLAGRRRHSSRECGRWRIRLGRPRMESSLDRAPGGVAALAGSAIGRRRPRPHRRRPAGRRRSARTPGASWPRPSRSCRLALRPGALPGPPPGSRGRRWPTGPGQRAGAAATGTRRPARTARSSGWPPRPRPGRAANSARISSTWCGQRPRRRRRHHPGPAGAWPGSPKGAAWSHCWPGVGRPGRSPSGVHRELTLVA